jgi:hypothetical protein
MIKQLPAGDAVWIFDAAELGAAIRLRAAKRFDGDHGWLANQHLTERGVGGRGGITGPVETFRLEVRVALVHARDLRRVFVWKPAIFVAGGCPAEHVGGYRGWRDGRVGPERVLWVVEAALELH